MGYTFGGYAARTWSRDACCADAANYCATSYCVYTSSSSGRFIFSIDPATAKFDPIDSSGSDYNQAGYAGETDYQQASSERWPEFGAHDLSFGWNDLPLSSNEAASCLQGTVYTGSPNQVCGGQYNWGETRLQVWRRAP